MSRGVSRSGARARALPLQRRLGGAARGIWRCLLVGLCILCLREPALADGQVDLYVLAIGVSRYPNFSAAEQLSFSDDDARSIGRWAEAQEGRLYRRVHVLVLEDQRATRRDILMAMRSHFGKARMQDQLILFLAGHGEVDPETGQYYFMPSDADRRERSGGIASTALSQAELLGQLGPRRRAEGRLLVLVDTCYAGRLSDRVEGAPSLDIPGPLIEAAEPAPAPLPSAGVPGQAGARGLHEVPSAGPTGAFTSLPEGARLWSIITAGTSTEQAPEGAQLRLPGEGPDIDGHGAFTSAILISLSSEEADLNRNGLITIHEFQASLARLVPERSGGVLTPTFTGRQGSVDLSFRHGTEEICDDRDNDLDGRVDEGFDANGNGLADCLEEEICDGIDNNGKGGIDETFDVDGDGHFSQALCGALRGDDCDDNDITIHPGQLDINNLVDDDCDSLIDEDGLRNRWDPGLPDGLERRDRSFTAGRIGSAAGGVALLGCSAVSLGLLASQRDALYSDGDPAELGQLTNDEVRRIVAASWTTVGCGVGAAASFSLAGTFSIAQRRFRLTSFPPERRRLPQPVPGGQAGRADAAAGPPELTPWSLAPTLGGDRP